MLVADNLSIGETVLVHQGAESGGDGSLLRSSHDGGRVGRVAILRLILYKGYVGEMWLLRTLQ